MKYETKFSKYHSGPTEHVFLGYTIDNTIKHLPHITKLCKRLASANYVLLKLKPLIDQRSLLSVYCAYIHSLISYAVTTWGNSPEINKVLVSQKKAVRIICGLRKRISAKPFFEKYKIMTVVSIYIYKSLIEIYKNRLNYIKRKDIHNYNLRNVDKLFIPQVRLQKVKNQGENVKLEMYNKLPTIITNIDNLNIFRRKIKLYFETNAFYSLNEFLNKTHKESSFVDEAKAD